jgi:hypothetical protein
MMTDTPITFTHSCWAIFDPAENAVRMTEFGSLAIFNTRIVAEQMAATSGSALMVVEVRITPINVASVRKN